MGILETGVNPEALADVIKQLRKEKQKLLDSESKTGAGETSTAE
jgi:hypothetical protein